LLLQNGTFLEAAKRKVAICGIPKGKKSPSKVLHEVQLMTEFFFKIKDLPAFARGARKFTLSIMLRTLRIAADACSVVVAGTVGSPWAADHLEHPERTLLGFLEGHNTVNTVGAEDTELAFVVASEVDEAATTLAGAG
jgi:hypothetical protein